MEIEKLLEGVKLIDNTENKLVNSQMIGIKPQINKDDSIKFSIKSRKMLFICRKRQIKWPTWVRLLKDRN